MDRLGLKMTRSLKRKDGKKRNGKQRKSAKSAKTSVNGTVRNTVTNESIVAARATAMRRIDVESGDEKAATVMVLEDKVTRIVTAKTIEGGIDTIRDENGGVAPN